MAAHAVRSEDALAALPFRTSLKEGQFNPAKIKFESGRPSMDEVLPLYTNRRDAYAYNPFATDAQSRSALETYMEEEGVGDLLLKYHPVHHESPAATPKASKQEEGSFSEEPAMATPNPYPSRKEAELPTFSGPSQCDLVARQMSRSDNALPLIRAEACPPLAQHISSRSNPARSDCEATLYTMDVSRKDAAAAAPQLPARSYIHICAKPPVETSRSEDESFKPTPGSWKGTGTDTSSSSKIKFESRRQETRSTATYSEFNTDSRRDSSDGSKDNKDMKASHPDNQQQRQRRPRAIEPTLVKQPCSDRHSSPGVMVDIPWLRTDDIAGMDCVALGSGSTKDWVDENGNRLSPELSPAGNRGSKRVQITMAPALPQEESQSSYSSVNSDSPPGMSTDLSAEQKRSWMQGNRAKSDRQLLTKNRETMVGRGQSFPTLAAGVISAEASGEWWSPSALRQRGDSRTARQSCRTYTGYDSTAMFGSDSPNEDVRQAAPPPPVRASAFQSTGAADYHELQQHTSEPQPGAASRSQRQSSAHSQASTSSSSTAWQSARPTLKSLDALGAEPILEETEQLDPEDRKAAALLPSCPPLRKENVVKMAVLRSRRNHRISMPLMEDVQDMSQALGQKLPGFKPYRGDLTVPRAPQQEQSPEFKSYRGDLAMSKIITYHNDPAALLSPTVQKRAQQSAYPRNP